jgi:hypothetical protein
MAVAFDTPCSRWLSIAELARLWPIGVSAERFAYQLVADLCSSDPDVIVCVFRYGPMRLGDYLAGLKAHPARVMAGTGNPVERLTRHIAGEIMVDAADVAAIADQYGYALPAWYNAWAAAGAPDEGPAAPLTREAAVSQIIAQGKVPGTPAYPTGKFETEVRRLCGGAKDQRGFSRRNLGRLYDTLKKNRPE